MKRMEPHRTAGMCGEPWIFAPSSADPGIEPTGFILKRPMRRYAPAGASGIETVLLSIRSEQVGPRVSAAVPDPRKPVPVHHFAGIYSEDTEVRSPLIVFQRM